MTPMGGSTQLTQWLETHDAPPLIVSSIQQSVLDEAVASIEENSPECVIVESDERSISIEQIRAVLSQVATTSWDGQRTVLIRNAERLTDQATSALLKALENVSSHTRFVFATRWQQRLLPTIRSRCQHIRLAAQRVPKSHVSEVPDVLELLADNAKAHHLDDETLAAIQGALEARLRQIGPSPELQRAYQRLRDYYLVASRRGSTKLTKDALIGSLAAK